MAIREKKAELAVFTWERFGFLGCIGSVYSSQMPVLNAPRVQPWTWWNRHDRCSIHILVVSDPNRNINAVTFGFQVRRPTPWYNSKRILHALQVSICLLARCCLENRECTMRTGWGPYIGHRGKTTTNENFAWQLARLRVISEHTIGIVKGRSASLKELCLPIESEEDFLAALGWILACFVLHNVSNFVNDGSV